LHQFLPAFLQFSFLKKGALPNEDGLALQVRLFPQRLGVLLKFVLEKTLFWRLFYDSVETFSFLLVVEDWSLGRVLAQQVLELRLGARAALVALEIEVAFLDFPQQVLEPLLLHVVVGVGVPDLGPLAHPLRLLPARRRGGIEEALELVVLEIQGFVPHAVCDVLGLASLLDPSVSGRGRCVYIFA